MTRSKGLIRPTPTTVRSDYPKLQALKPLKSCPHASTTPLMELHFESALLYSVLACTECARILRQRLKHIYGQMTVHKYAPDGGRSFIDKSVDKLVAVMKLV